MPEGPADELVEAAESLSIRAAVEGFSERRVSLVRRVLNEWRQQLIDLTGRNNLLRYRDLRLGTLDLTAGDQETLTQLLRGRPVRISHLFPNPEEKDPPTRRARAIHKKAKENFEERGLET